MLLDGVAFSIEILECDRIFLIFGVRQFFIFTVSKHARMFVLRMKSKVFLIQFKSCDRLEVTKVGYTIGHRIDYNRGRGSERPVAHTQQKLTQVTPCPPLPGTRLRKRKGFHFSEEARKRDLSMHSTF